MKNAPATVRPARPADAERVALLSGQLGYPSTPSEVRLRMEAISGDVRHALLVADLPGREVVGWLHVFETTTVESGLRAEIAGLVVEESCRGRGVGGSLMEQAEAWARGRGCPVVSLRTNVIRAEAHRFYRDRGYTIRKTQHAFQKRLAEKG